ncbi:uncharacterized protein TNCV_4203051 [Trichonephila clavipes]|uniref:Uncharacterized protein n=2 Tax=Trichonephila clavipes TaxID=2585209 RepID=A0A8X6S559_TRICX|nr:uncharacterized protein TNCV_4203051 [Trichonephila clavipes]
MNFQLGDHGCGYPGRCIPDRSVFNKQGNAQTPVAGIVWIFLDTENTHLFPWPARSPNLSLMKNVWSKVAVRLALHHTPVTTIDELWHCVEAAWTSVPVHAIKYLFDSRPKRISAVIFVRGGCFGRKMNRIRQHVHLLHVLSAASPQQRNAILKSATNEQIKTLCEICQNVLAGNVPKANVKRLCRYKRTIRQLADRSISLGRKRKLLTTNQTGGFLPLVLPAVLSFVGGLLGKTIGKRI